ncbi:winged helix-turn-helix transcriptional regulator [Nocardia seriolae]|uniref:HxlR family transcriptional regulator n=1 Tax=Nocardia seriolae TaxID=37332 RepID=A0A0B8N5W5_9NOCA|nr:helix-turn-helix domain-containing protein [Nocardia seriolae]MTJ63583.1 transcriptional regulator [Nocardia seriolae]MTJ72434.1 transcriptional regulator [Nocardia seriolae]MTJ88459.1 transcriptional regulator [Nocardia seriolae]MTK32443.1 transcriptional regulator [Nocardia seriolae]MTK41482.1 transcriptional regulator [Nocardia seriolae]
MQRKSFQGMSCPIAGALEQVGDWWTLLIMRDVLDGFTRFDELERNLGITPTTLTSRLRTLAEAGLVERVQYSANPPRYEYPATESGRDLAPVIVALYNWGAKHSAVRDSQVILVDQSSGERIDPVFVDRNSGRRLSELDAAFLPGPEADAFMQTRLDPALRRSRRQRRNSSPDIPD